VGRITKFSSFNNKTGTLLKATRKATTLFLNFLEKSELTKFLVFDNNRNTFESNKESNNNFSLLHIECKSD
jgi:hypothetical protein